MDKSTSKHLETDVKMGNGLFVCSQMFYIVKYMYIKQLNGAKGFMEELFRFFKEIY